MTAASDSLSIDSVAVVPDYCYRCGTELGWNEFEGTELPWCPDCNLVFSRNPVPGVHVVVRDGERVLVLDEPIPQHQGLLSLPGGHARPDESPKEAVVRELEEETGLSADPGDLSFVTVLHAELPEVAFYLLTYVVDREDVSGELTTEFEDGKAYFASLEDLRDDPDCIRDSDLGRIEQALQV